MPATNKISKWTLFQARALVNQARDDRCRHRAQAAQQQQRQQHQQRQRQQRAEEQRRARELQARRQIQQPYQDLLRQFDEVQRTSSRGRIRKPAGVLQMSMGGGLTNIVTSEQATVIRQRPQRQQQQQQQQERQHRHQRGRR
ncbi:matrix metalloproteinase-2-like [Haliotis asinina]|uniref:matrix metalloproteinase-2-like n=1 Tax=Haliotis asinina TaxID=109174 RepID=UPI003531FE27